MSNLPNKFTPKAIMRMMLDAETFRVERMIYIKRRTLMIMALLGLSVYGNYMHVMAKPRVSHFLTRSDGVLIALNDIKEPKHSDSFIIDWATDNVVKTFTFDYANYRTQFNEIQKNMTMFGWKAFLRALQDSGNFEAIKGNSYIASAVPTGPAQIIKQGIFIDRYAWRVRVPILVTYQSSIRRTTQDLVLDVVIARMPEYINPDGVAIRQITPQIE